MKQKHMKKILQIGLISAGLLALTACSTTGSRTAANGQSSGTTTIGLGPNATVRGMNVPNAILLKAPYNQSYYFNFNQSLVKANYFASIRAQANYLLQHPRARVLIAGNTDARGSHEYNIALGERRAKAVANRLRRAGVNRRQVRVISYGDMKPIALGHSSLAYAKNRRVDLTYEAK